MVEETVILVIVEDEDGLGPDVRIGGEGGDQPGTERLAISGRCVGMLAHVEGGDDPGHLRQAVRHHVGGEGADQMLPARRAGIRAGGTVDPGTRRRIFGAILRDPAIPGEQRQGIVAVIVVFLIELPPDPRGRETCGIGRPVQRMRLDIVAAHIGGLVRIDAVIGDDERAIAPDGKAAGARPVIEAVGAGRPVDRAVIGVRDGELIGERVIIGQVGAGHIAHRERALLRHPHVPVLPPGMASLPTVVEALHAAGGGGAGVEMEGADDRAAILVVLPLLPDRPARRQHGRARIGESAHAPQRAEIMVEGAVLLHQDHDMLDIRERAARAGGLGKRRGRGGEGAGAGHEGAAVDMGALHDRRLPDLDYILA